MFEPNDIIGWFASALLIFTVGWQIRKQYLARSAEGVSKYMFIGQLIAGIGLCIYSYNLKNWVFTFTNAFLVLENSVGFYLTLKFKREADQKSERNP